MFKQVLPHLLKRKNGKRSGIVVTSSTAAKNMTPGVATYCATKAFASYMSRALNFEFKEDNIDVLAF